MKNLLIWVCSLWLLLTLPMLHAQPTNNQFGDVTVPSAEGFAMGRDMETTTNPLTGVPSFSIPIHSVVDNRISLPISLSYNFSGIRVADPASRVGMGWSLNAGGSISRSVLGIPDESQKGVLKYTGTITAEDVDDGTTDAESDVFSYSMGNYSGKFVMENDSGVIKVIQMPRTDNKIIPTNADLKEFLIITPDGTRYIFGSQTNPAAYTGTQEYTYQNTPLARDGDGDPKQVQKSSSATRIEWYLRKVQSYDQKDEIHLTYEEQTYGLHMPTTQEYGDYRVISGSYNCGGSWPLYNCSVGGLDASGAIDNKGSSIFFPSGTDTRFGADLYFNRVSYRVRVVKSIYDNSGTTVQFNSSSQARQDVSAFNFENIGNPSVSSNAFALSEIIISEGSFSKKFSLTHSYFLAQSNPAFPFDRRLKLDAIQESSGSLSKPEYSFTYYDKGSTEGYSFLPWRLSKAVDQMGFYNGKDGNNNFEYNIEPVCLPVKLNGITATFMFGQADRSADYASMRYGTLRSVTFPEGGTTHFDMGAHKEWNPESSVSYGPLPGPTISEFTTNYPDSCYQLSLQGINGGRGTEKSRSFTLTNDIFNSYVLIQAEITCTGPQQRRPNKSTTSNPQGEWLAVIMDNQGNEISRSEGEFMGNSYAANNHVPFTEIFGGLNANHINQSLTLDLIGFESNVKFKLFERTVIGANEDRPGLRVDSIRYTDINNTLLKKVEYDYTNEGNHHSNGRYLVPNTFSYVSYSTGTHSDIQNVTYSTLIRKASSGGFWPLSDFSGNHYAYSRVATKTSGDGGLTVYINSPQAIDLQDITADAPFVPFDYFPANNTPDHVQQRKSDGTLVQQTTNGIQNSIGTIGEKFNFRVKSYQANNGLTTHYSISDYHNESHFATLNYDIKKLYYPEGEVETRNDYIYTALSDHMQPTVIESTNSNGVVHITRLKYPQDYTANTAVKNKLIDQNRILPAWQSEELVDTTVIDGQRSTFRFYNTNGITNTASESLHLSQTARREVTWKEDSSLVNSGWVVQQDISQYDIQVGKPKMLTINGWADPFEYQWTSNGQLDYWKFKDFKKVHEYYGSSNLLKSIRDIDSTLTTYTYDDLMRLSTTTNCQKSKVSLKYHYQSGSADKNYVQTDIYYPKFGEELVPTTLSNKVFYDGYARQIGSTRIDQDPSSATQHISTWTTYDLAGRVQRQYEPRTNSDTLYTTPPVGAQYTLTTYEPSPMARVTQVLPPQSGPNDILGRISTTYSTNTANEVDRYAAGKLYKVTQTDAEGQETSTYSDRRGNVVLSRVQTGSKVANTYTRYDLKDRKSIVIPPDVMINADGSIPEKSKHLVHRSIYYGDDLLWKKKVPDKKNFETFIYNTRDLLAYRQDDHLAKRGREGLWYAIQYDDYGRSILEGFSTDSAFVVPTHNQVVQAQINTKLLKNQYGTTGIEKGKMIYQGAGILPIGGPEGGIQRYWKYDDCGRLKRIWGSSIKARADTSSYAMSYTYDDADNVLTTTEKLPLSNDPITMVTRKVYDHAGRHTADYLKVNNLTEQKVFSQTYTGKEQIKRLTLGNNLQYVDYSYLPNGYLAGINDVNNMGSDLFAMQLGYHDDITGVSGATLLDDGNISAIRWRHGSANPQTYLYQYDYLKRLTAANYKESGRNNRYNTTYDYLDARGNIDKITRMGMMDGSTGQTDNLQFNYYPNSNQVRTITDGITSALKSGGYKSGTGEYTYDDNGAMTHDPSRRADITLNHLTLPTSIAVPDSNAVIYYYYDATGAYHGYGEERDGAIVKSRQHVGSAEYYGGILDQIHTSQGYVELTYPGTLVNHVTQNPIPSNIYEGSVSVKSSSNVAGGSNVIFQAGQMICLETPFSIPLGADFTAQIINVEPNGFLQNFVIRDHLGNARVVFAKIGNSIEAVDRNDYYPFGLEHQGSISTNNRNKYKHLFTGQERHRELDLGYDFFAARVYDSGRVGWNSVDPEASTMPNWSGYSYSFGDPISYFDPDGKAPDWIYKQQADGTYKKVSEAGGANNHTFINNDGTTMFHNVKAGTFTTIRPKQMMANLENYRKTSDGERIGKAIQAAGDGIAAGGYLTSIITEGASLAVAAVGEGISFAGKLIENFSKFKKDGVTEENVIDASVDVFFEATPLIIENSVKKANIDALTKDMIKTEVGKLNKTAEFITDSKIEEQRKSN